MKYYVCSSCELMFNSNNKNPICYMCNSKNYGLRHIIRKLFNWGYLNLKEYLFSILIGINIMIWIFGIIKIVECIK